MGLRDRPPLALIDPPKIRNHGGNRLKLVTWDLLIERYVKKYTGKRRVRDHRDAMGTRHVTDPEGDLIGTLGAPLSGLPCWPGHRRSATA